jgi:ribose transport system ATP-binding protein
MVSSEMPELISLADRVVVIRGGGIAATLGGPAVTEEQIILSSMGRTGGDAQ